MNGDANGHLEPTAHSYDIIIVGAGISGVDAAYRIKTLLPHVSFTVLEGRHELGGTWSLFKYPGIRSDSDLHTFGFPFNPWEKPNPIATGESIIDYMHATTKKFGLDSKIQYGHKVMQADWRSGEQKWRLEVDNHGRRKVCWAKFVIMGTGYYDYDQPLKADIPGLERFQGITVHPQFWPEDLDYRGKKMAVIGSGATSVTIIPAVVENGVGSVVQVQRSPSYIVNMPQRKPDDPLPLVERFLPRWMSLYILRMQFMVFGILLYAFCRQFPRLARWIVRTEARKQLPENFPIDPHLEPRYDPWDQRMCFVPDSDYFKCFGTGRARIVTGTIKTVVEDGIEMNDGEKIDADIIVTATGLNIRVMGGIPLTVDNKPVHVPDHFLWRTMMLNDIPNLCTVIGYVNASWTLGADSTARLFVRLYKLMEENGYTCVFPKIGENEMKDPVPVLGLNSTYVKAAAKKFPRAANSGPWRPRDNPIFENWRATRADLRDGLQFDTVAT